MVILHSYVSLPEGIPHHTPSTITWDEKVTMFPMGCQSQGLPQAPAMDCSGTAPWFLEENHWENIWEDNGKIDEHIGFPKYGKFIFAYGKPHENPHGNLQIPCLFLRCFSHRHSWVLLISTTARWVEAFWICCAFFSFR